MDQNYHIEAIVAENWYSEQLYAARIDEQVNRNMFIFSCYLSNLF